MKQPVWILGDAVEAIHKRQLAEHGGSEGVCDAGLLASAMARPQNTFAYEDGVSLARLAAQYMVGLARKRPFVEGSVRTAIVAGLLFLRLNGKTVNAIPEDCYRVFRKLSEMEFGAGKLEKWLQVRLKGIERK